MVLGRIKLRREGRRSSGGGLRTSMRGCHAQSCQTTAIKRRRGAFPDFVSARIKISAQRIVNLHLFVPVADEVGFAADYELNIQIIRSWIVGSGRNITPGIQTGDSHRLITRIRPASRTNEDFELDSINGIRNGSG